MSSNEIVEVYESASKKSRLEYRNVRRSSDKFRPKKRPSAEHLSPTGTSSKSNDVVVFDSGAYSVKVGLLHDAHPKVMPNCIMKAKSERKRLFISEQIEDCRDKAGLFYLLPCEKGYITKWDIQKPIWDHIFGRNNFPLTDRSLLMTQPLFNFKTIQNCMDEIFFEEYDIKSLHRCNPTDLASLKYLKSYPNEHKACLIVDSGYSFTNVVPYIKGKKYPKGIQRLNVGGKLLTNYLKDIISYRQYHVMEETYVINQVKEDACLVSQNFLNDLKYAKENYQNSIVQNYVLPDFNTIRRGYIQNPENANENEENCQILKLNNERFTVPELLFYPSDIGMKSQGLPEAINNSLKRCPKKYRSALSTNIVLIGGCVKFPGFKERLYNDLRSRLASGLDINIFIPQDPVAYAWQGGKTLMAQKKSQDFFVTKQEYDEIGNLIQGRFNSWDTDDIIEDNPERNISERPKSILESLRCYNQFKDLDFSELIATPVSDIAELASRDPKSETLVKTETEKNPASTSEENKDPVEEKPEEVKILDNVLQRVVNREKRKKLLETEELEYAQIIPKESILSSSETRSKYTDDEYHETFVNVPELFPLGFKYI